MERPARRFAFRLARELGLPMAEMLRRMSSAELSEWLAFYELEAEDARRRDLARRAERGVKMRRRRP